MKATPLGTLLLTLMIALAFSAALALTLDVQQFAGVLTANIRCATLDGWSVCAMRGARSPVWEIATCVNR